MAKILKLSGYALVVAILLILAVLTWIASSWWLNPLVLFPLYIPGFIICALILYGIHRRS